MKVAIVLLCLAALLAAEVPPIAAPDSTAKADSAAVQDSLRTARMVEAAERRSDVKLGTTVLALLGIAVVVFVFRNQM